MRSLCLVGSLCLILLSSAAWSASEDSAKQAVQATYPNLPEAQAKALVALLVSLEDGSVLTVNLDGKEGKFHVEGGVVKVGLPAALGQFNSAAAFTLAKQLDLKPFQAELRRTNREITSGSDEAVTFIFATTGDMLTVTRKGTVCIRSRNPLDGLAAVDRLGGQLSEALAHLRKVNATIDDAQVQQGWVERRYYSTPPYTYMSAVFSSGKGDLNTIPRDFAATIRIPDIEVKEARLQVWRLEKQWPMSNFFLDGGQIVKAGPPGLTGPLWAGADVSDILVFGERQLTHTVANTPLNSACNFVVDLILRTGQQTEFQAAAGGQTVTSLSLQPMDKLTEQWEDLRDALRP